MKHASQIAFATVCKLGWNLLACVLSLVALLLSPGKLLILIVEQVILVEALGQPIAATTHHTRDEGMRQCLIVSLEHRVLRARAIVIAKTSKRLIVRSSVLQVYGSFVISEALIY